MRTDASPEGSPRTSGPPLWARVLRREVHLVLDLFVLAAAFLLAYLLRFDFDVPEDYRLRALLQLPGVMLLQFLVLAATGVYQLVWRYVGMADVWTFLRGAVYSATPLLLLRFGLPDSYQDFRIPLSIILMDTALAFGGLLGLRVLRRALYERYERRRHVEKRGAAARQRTPVLLAGAGQAGVLAVKELRGRGRGDVEPVGFVDDDPVKRGTVIQGLRVLGSTAEIPALAEELEVDQVIITMAAANAGTIRRIVEICERGGLRVRIIPGLYEILTGQVSISRIRDLQIEDLLGREPVRLDQRTLEEFLGGKTVLITGAGGSIGGELCRQTARFGPRRLVALDRSEGALFEIERELGLLWPDLEVAAEVADVLDQPRLRRLLERHRPEVLIHAAAHKHVPMMERHPGEAVRNNALAVDRLGRQAAEAGVEAFVLVSTDKAVRPTSIMGATKRLAELVCQELDARYPDSRFLAVRFGNVLDSAGSVVPIFREQIARGGPVEVTHPEVRRYFMTIPEAAQLVLQAGAIGRGGEILILDMGEPVKIVDLARDMIRLTGHPKIEIEFTGLRPGEKLFEQLELEEERCERTRHPKIYVGRLQPSASGALERLLGELDALIEAGDDRGVRRLLDDFLPESSLGQPPAHPERRGTRVAG